MRLNEIMTKNVHSIAIETDTREVWELMHQKKIHHLVVMDGNTVAGVITERDLGGTKGKEVREQHTLAELMSDHTVTASPHTTVREAANLMRGNTIGCLPVMEKNKLVGIVTITDLLTLLGRGAQRVTGDGDRQDVSEATIARSRPRKNMQPTRNRPMGRGR